MNAFQPEDLEDKDADDLYLIYNNKHTFVNSSEAEVIVDWMSFALEYKIFRHRFNQLKKKIPLLNNIILEKVKEISKINKEKESVQRKMKDIKKYLETDKNYSFHSAETTKVSRRNYSIPDLRHLNSSKNLITMHEYKDLRLDTNELCQDNYVKSKHIEIPAIAYENENELKCCRLRYFCF
jgi:aromatic ring hydroxylase